ncbi:hypothetical protein V5P93_004282 [Actinokineospora auranticolor]|uniref:hypothetical protein n=1 Tax=Actinokineospora auranticolor TaxID=155976 RepID=UPI0011B0826D|nr:hypothetical protein [Actinokineospora auranticolor]
MGSAALGLATIEEFGWPWWMTTTTAVARTAVFAVLFFASNTAGRLTVLDAVNLSQVWPLPGSRRCGCARNAAHPCCFEIFKNKEEDCEKIVLKP